MIALGAFVDGCWDFSGGSENLYGLPIDYAVVYYYFSVYFLHYEDVSDGDRLLEVLPSSPQK